MFGSDSFNYQEITNLLRLAKGKKTLLYGYRWQTSRTGMKSVNSQDQILSLALSWSKWSFQFLLFLYVFSALLPTDLLPIHLLCLLILMVVQIFNLKICLFNLFNLKSKYLLDTDCVLGIDDFILPVAPTLSHLLSVSFCLFWLLDKPIIYFFIIQI